MSKPQITTSSKTVPAVVIETPNGLSVIPYEKFVATLIKPFPDRILELAHSALGISGESGEYADAIKKHIIYGKPVDRENIKEELGDLLFYIQDAMTKFNFTWDEVLQANVDKLSKRYVELKYSDSAAIERADKKEEKEETENPDKYKYHYVVRNDFDPTVDDPRLGPFTVYADAYINLYGNQYGQLTEKVFSTNENLGEFKRGT